MAKELKGATIVKEELLDEAGAKLREANKTSSFEEFLDAMKKAEEENLKPLSGDMEVMKDVDDKTLQQLQEDKRLIGYVPKTRTAMVLKLAFLQKKKARGED